MRAVRRSGIALAGIAALAVAAAPSAGSPAAQTRASFTAPASFAAKKPITIGAPLPFTGTLAYYGQEYRRGMEQAAKTINATGGIAGRKLQFRFVDAPDATKQADAIRFLKAQRINIWAGSGSSSFDIADTAVAEQLKMVSWTMGVDKTLTEKGYKNVVQAAVSTNDFIAPSIGLLPQIATKLKKDVDDLKVALVSSNDAYGQSNTALQESLLKRRGVDVVLKQSYDKAATDLSSVVLRIRSANPDVVLQTGYTDDVVLMWRQAKQMGWAPKFMIGSGGTASTNFKEALGSWANGFIAYSYALPTAKSKVSMAFGKNYRKAYGIDLPSGHALMVYSSILRLGDVLRAAKTDSPAKFMAAAKKMNKPTGFYPDGCGLKLNAGGRNIRCATTGLQWQKGTLRLVWPARLADVSLQGPLPVK